MQKDLETEIALRVARVMGVYVRTPEVRLANELIDRTRIKRRGGGEALCALITGVSGCGKSRIFQLYMASQPAAAPDTMPVLAFETPSPFSMKAILDSMLTAMGVEGFPGRHDVVQMRNRVLYYLNKLKVQVILMEEVQHIVDRKERTAKIPYWALDFIKLYLLDKAKVPVVMNGIPAAKDMFLINGQMEQRREGTVELTPYDSADAIRRRQFMLLLEKFEVEAGFPNAFLKGNDALCRRVLRATEGIHGLVAKLMADATEIGVRMGAPGLTADVLALAFARRATPKKGWVNPLLVDVAPPAKVPDETRVTALKKRNKDAA